MYGANRLVRGVSQREREKGGEGWNEAKRIKPWNCQLRGYKTVSFIRGAMDELSTEKRGGGGRSEWENSNLLGLQGCKLYLKKMNGYKWGDTGERGKGGLN